MIVDCPNCNVTAEAKPIAYYEDRNPYIDEGDRFSFLKCPSCSQPILMKSELVWEFNGYVWATPTRIYPLNEFYVNPSIPELLRNALVESIKCFKAGSYTATAIMCRRTIEGFCQIKEVKERDLAKSLESLKSKGVINDQIYEWANQLRLTGNEAAHNIECNFTNEDTKDILDFTIAILDFSYSFKDKFDRFSKRHSKQKGTSKSSDTTLQSN